MCTRNITGKNSNFEVFAFESIKRVNRYLSRTFCRRTVDSVKRFLRTYSVQFFRKKSVPDYALSATRVLRFITHDLFEKGNSSENETVGNRASRKTL